MIVRNRITIFIYSLGNNGWSAVDGSLFANNCGAKRYDHRAGTQIKAKSRRNASDHRSMRMRLQSMQVNRSFRRFD